MDTVGVRLVGKDQEKDPKRFISASFNEGVNMTTPMFCDVHWTLTGFQVELNIPVVIKCFKWLVIHLFERLLTPGDTVTMVISQGYLTKMFLGTVQAHLH